MSEIKPIPKEILDIVPKYGGEENLLNLYLSKCNYILSGSTVIGNHTQNEYIFHALSSKLTGRAAVLLSDHPEIKSYDELKDLLTQHFGDPRSEECVAIELEMLKIEQGESYIQFCQRIQNVRSSLFAKVHRLRDEGLKAAKLIVYNNTALNVFLYNLPEDMIRIVRLKGCTNLEAALGVVTEEVNFKYQYQNKNKVSKQTPSQYPQTALRPTPLGFKPIFNSVPNNNFRFAPPPNNFKFGIPQNQNQYVPRPNFAPQMRFGHPSSGFKFGNTPQRNFGQTPAQHTSSQNGGYRFGSPQQQAFRFGAPHQYQGQQVQAPRFQDTDVSMRTAPIRQPTRFQNTDASMRTAPIKQNLISNNANNLYYMEETTYPECNQDYNDLGYYAESVDHPYNDCNYLENNEESYSDPCTEFVDETNFSNQASKETTK